MREVAEWFALEVCRIVVDVPNQAALALGMLVNNVVLMSL